MYSKKRDVSLVKISRPFHIVYYFKNGCVKLNFKEVSEINFGSKINHFRTAEKQIITKLTALFSKKTIITVHVLLVCPTYMYFKKYIFKNFRQRLELMREMYQNDAEVSPSSPDTSKQEVNLNADPFYDRFPW